jgi:hypothetical protein
MRERGGESDLKAGHERPKTEYIRMYISVFDRTPVGAWVVCALCVRMYSSTFERMRAVQ